MIKKSETDLSVDDYLGNYSAISDSAHLSLHSQRYNFACSFIKSADTVLDMGCGEGFGTDILAGKAKKAVGVDYHEMVVNQARQKYGTKRDNISFMSGDCYQLRFDSPFDVVCAFDLIEHLPDDVLFIKKMSEVLKKNGTLILSTPNKLIHMLQLGKIYEFHQKEYFHSEIIDLVKARFSNIEVYVQDPGSLYDSVGLDTILKYRLSARLPISLKKHIKSLARLIGTGKGAAEERQHRIIKPVSGTDLVTCSDFVIIARNGQ